jgi:hypothetical protein
MQPGFPRFAQPLEHQVGAFYRALALGADTVTHDALGIQNYEGAVELGYAVLEKVREGAPGPEAGLEFYHAIANLKLFFRKNGMPLPEGSAAELRSISAPPIETFLFRLEGFSPSPEIIGGFYRDLATAQHALHFRGPSYAQGLIEGSCADPVRFSGRLRFGAYPLFRGGARPDAEGFGLDAEATRRRTR